MQNESAMEIIFKPQWRSDDVLVVVAMGKFANDVPNHFEIPERKEVEIGGWERWLQATRRARIDQMIFNRAKM